MAPPNAVTLSPIADSSGPVHANRCLTLIKTVISYAIDDDDPWLCYQPEYHYDNHEIAGPCAGYDLDHYAMKMRGVEELGG